MQERCEICRFWLPAECRRNPPVALVTLQRNNGMDSALQSYVETHWPSTGPNQWCGHFKVTKDAERIAAVAAQRMTQGGK